MKSEMAATLASQDQLDKVDRGRRRYNTEQRSVVRCSLSPAERLKRGETRFVFVRFHESGIYVISTVLLLLPPPPSRALKSILVFDNIRERELEGKGIAEKRPRGRDRVQ